MGFCQCLKEITYISFPFLYDLLYPLNEKQDLALYKCEAEKIAEKFIPPIDHGIERLQEVRLAYQRNDSRLDSIQTKAKDYLIFSAAVLTVLVTVIVYATTSALDGLPIKLFTHGWHVPKVMLLTSLFYLLMSIVFCMRTLEKASYFAIGEQDITDTKENINTLIQVYLKNNHMNHGRINLKVDYFESAHRCLTNAMFLLFTGLIFFLIFLK